MYPKEQELAGSRKGDSRQRELRWRGTTSLVALIVKNSPAMQETQV